MSDGSDCNTGRDAYLVEWRLLKERLPELQREFALAAEGGSLITDWMVRSSRLPIAER